MNRRRLVCMLVIPGAAFWALACTGDDPTVTPGGTSPDAAPESSQVDASPLDANSVETGTDAAPACNPLAPFTDIAPLAGVNTADTEDGARMSSDELTLHFARLVGGGKFDLYVATRSDRASAFGNVTLVDATNTSTADESYPSVGGDSLFFSSNRDDGGLGVERVWSSARAPDGGWGSPTELTTVGAPGKDATFPFVMPDGLHLYFVSERPNNEKGFAIWRAERSTTTLPFGNATNLAELNMPLGLPHLDGYPAVTADERTIYFTSYRPTADAGDHGFNVFMAKRMSAASGFSTPVEVTELNTGDEEWPTWISADGCRILFVSNRQGTMSGSRDIWQAHRGM